jgi:hypothetical protein
MKLLLRCICLTAIFKIGALQAQFNPTDLDTLVFFVESTRIDTHYHVARCITNACLNHPNTEQAPIAEQYCDLTVCPDGCVRRWPDQSGTLPYGGFNPPEFTEGRNFGQDDSEKPCYIPNCLNGKPCVRGGAPYGAFVQDKYLENQVPDIMTLDNAFSIFLLCRPIDQLATGDWFYLGQAHSNLQHKVSNNSLKLRVNGTYPVLQLTTPNSVNINEWQLIEVHRSLNDSITSIINGVDKTNGPLMNPGQFRLGYLFSNFKTEGGVAMYGDIAACAVYEGELTEQNRQDIRDYFNGIYAYDSTSISGVENEAMIDDMAIYPNPSKNGFTVNFYLNSAAFVKMSISTITGKKIPLSEEEEMEAGLHKIFIPQLSPDFAPGIYFLHLEVNGKTYVHKLQIN